MIVLEIVIASLGAWAFAWLAYATWIDVRESREQQRKQRENEAKLEELAYQIRRANERELR
jgi:Flp pilus assembly protein TadB